MEDVSRLIDAAAAGDTTAATELLPLVYADLRRLAAARLSAERPGQTFEATALVHEAYLRLVGTRDRGWSGRRHFFAAAAEAMRRILVENARRKQGPTRGGHLRRSDADLDLVAAVEPTVDLLALDEALTRLAAEAPARAELVKLRFFAGLTMPEAAEVLGVSLATAERHWTFAKAWLFDELGGTDPF